MIDEVICIPLHGLSPGDDSPTDSDHPAAMGSAPFVVGVENRLVEAAVHTVLDGASPLGNPLYVHGATGSGKTHLLRGLVAVWKDLHRGTTCYVTADDFARHLGDAQDTNALDEFRQQYRGAALLAVDDVGRLSGKAVPQEELAATIDAVLALGNRVLVSGPLPAEQLGGFSPRLIARLVGGLSLPLALPEADARFVLLKELAAQRGLSPPESVVRLLANRLQGSPWELAAALSHLDMAVKLEGEQWTIDEAQRYLDQRQRPRLPGVKEIAVATARHFSLRLGELRSSSRRQEVVRARGVAMYLTRLLTGESLEQIGRYFGGRDHTTVLHGCRKTELLLHSEPLIRQAIGQLRQQLQNGLGKRCG